MWAPLLHFCLKILLSLVLAPILFVIFSINEVVRWTISMYLCLTDPDTSLVTSGVECVALVPGNEAGGPILAIITTDYNPNEDISVLLREDEELLKRICENPNYAKLTRIFSTAGRGLYSCLRRCDFDVKNHIRKWESVKEFITEEEFFTEVIPQLSQDFPPSRWAFPRWEWVVMEKVQFVDLEKLQTVRAFRVHHAIMDGVCQGTLLGEEIMNFPNTTRPPFIVDPRVAQSVPGGWRGMTLSLSGFLGIPWILAESFLKKLDVGDPMMLRTLSKGERHHTVSPRVELNSLKAAKSRMETVLGTQVSMTSFLCEGVKDAVKKPLPTGVSCSVGQRIWRIGHPYAVLPRKKPRLENNFIVRQVDIPLDITDSNLCLPPAGLWKDFAFMGLVNAIGRLPMGILAAMQKQQGRGAPVSSTMLTNVPFTRTAGYIGKERVNIVGAWSPLYIPNGLALAFVSYGEELRVWGAVDGEVMGQQECQNFLNTIATSFAEQIFV